MKWNPQLTTPDFLKKISTGQVLSPTNRYDKDKTALAAWMCIQMDLGCRKARMRENISRTEIIILCRIYLSNTQGIPVSLGRILKGWRVDYKRVQGYIDRLVLRDYISIELRPRANFSRKQTRYFSITMAGLSLIQSINNLLIP